MARFVSLSNADMDRMKEKRADCPCIDQDGPERCIAEFVVTVIKQGSSETDCKEGTELLLAGRTRRIIDRDCRVLLEPLEEDAVEFEENPMRLHISPRRPDGSMFPFARSQRIKRKKRTRLRISISNQWDDPKERPMCTLQIDL